MPPERIVSSLSENCTLASELFLLTYALACAFVLELCAFHVGSGIEAPEQETPVAENMLQGCTK
jgi:hypothetical protein